MFGKSLTEYLRLQIWVLLAVVVIFAARWGLSQAGVPAARWASVTWVLLLGTVYYDGKVYEERWFVDTEQWKAAF